MSNVNDKLPGLAADAVLVKSAPVPSDFVECTGIDYSKDSAYDISASQLVANMKTMGFQGSALGRACDIIDSMRAWRGKHKSELADHEQKGDFDDEGYQKTTIFLGYTSNLISSGLRETIRFLVQYKFVSAVVSSAGGIEEDLIKCLAPTYLGDFALSGSKLRAEGMNRIGNLLVPNDNYCKFEEWIVPILDQMLAEQEEAAAKSKEHSFDSDSLVWTPSTFIDRLGKEINDESSVLYWAHKNKIPVFCPSLTDGSIGDMLFFHTFKSSPKQLRVDLVADIRKINSLSMAASHAGMIILGGGLIKHHIANACLMRNGADFAVYINTGQEFDGCDAGARPDEAVSWGKIKAEAPSVKVYADATLVFPLIVGATFAKTRPQPVKKA